MRESCFKITGSFNTFFSASIVSFRRNQWTWTKDFDICLKLYSQHATPHQCICAIQQCHLELKESIAAVNYEWVQICSSTYCHDLSSTLTQCVFACVCVCAHLVSHLRCDLYSYNYSWSVSCQVMTFTFMHESDKDAEQHILKHTFLMSCSGIIYHHRGNKGIALLHECGQNGTECVRVTLRTTCTNYLKTQQSTDRTNTASRHLSSILVWKHPGCSGEHKIKSEWKCLTQLSVCSPQGISVILAISCFEGELLYSQAETQMA